MRDAGKLEIFELLNVAQPGKMPAERLVKVGEAYYTELTVRATRAYAALSADQQIDKLVRCYNTAIPFKAGYVRLDNGDQYRISLKQEYRDNVDLTLVRLEDYYDVSPE